jgi:replicative DNA helicase
VASVTDTLRPANGHGNAAKAAEFAAQIASTQADDWPQVEPLGMPKLPRFPIDHLPNVLADMAAAAAAEVQAPEDMAAMLSLSTTAAAIAGKVEVLARAGHVEQLCLWTFVAAESAERKTPVFNILRRPFTDYELAHQGERLMERRRKESEGKKLEGALAALIKKAIRDGSINQQAEEEDLHRRLEDLYIPPKLQLWVSSPTPEAVHNLLSEHEGRMAVFSDEGGLFGIIAGRYAGKAGGADIDPFLQGFNGSPLRAPRVTAERKNVAAAYLTMGFAVQPKVLADLGSVEGVEDKGLIGRFLFSIPTSQVGKRGYRDSVPMAEDIVATYHATMTRLIEMKVPDRPHQLILAPDAFEEYADFADRIEARADKHDGDLAGIGSWVGKIAGTTLRVAGIFHMVESDDPLSESISAATIRHAAALTEEYLIPHALGAFRILRHGADKSILHRLVAWLEAKEIRQFRVRDAYQRLKGSGGKVQEVADLDPALTRLVDGGYIRQVPARRADSVVYEVNPLWDFQ